MRVLICGDRNWTQFEPIEREIEKLPKGSVVIQGEAKGADTIAKIVAKKYKLDVISFPANWRKYGKSAGPIRNTQMINEGDPQEVWAFHADIKSSKGTADMVKQARLHNIPVTVFTK